MSCSQADNIFFHVEPAGVQPDQQMELFRILAAVLHLGNIHVQASGRSSDRSYIDVKKHRGFPDIRHVFILFCVPRNAHS